MQPKTHAFVISAAVTASGHPWLLRYLSELLAGCQDEDVWLIGPLRLRAPGLTHTYKPGSEYGELWTRSARTGLLRCTARARASVRGADAAHWLGRACHLLGDMAVPARTRGVWHLLGDPLEAYWEAHAIEHLRLLDQIPELGLAHTPSDLAESLARASSAFSVDTTRTPWGALARAIFGRGEVLDESSIAQQAKALLPLAVAHTRALLESEARERTE